MITRDEIIAAAREYIGTPYRHQGRCKGAGVDCVGLVVCVAADLGIKLEDHTRYRRNPDGSLLPHVRRELVEISPENARVGDLFMVYVRTPELPQHFMFWTGERIIHAFDGGPRKVVETNIGKWQRRIVTAFELPGVEHD